MGQPNLDLSKWFLIIYFLSILFRQIRIFEINIKFLIFFILNGTYVKAKNSPLRRAIFQKPQLRKKPLIIQKILLSKIFLEFLFSSKTVRHILILKKKFKIIVSHCPERRGGGIKIYNKTTGFLQKKTSSWRFF